MSRTANGRRVVTISLIFFVVANLVWLGMPFGMAILWSLVDPAHPWSYPDIFPPVLSFSRWLLVWEKTSLSEALFNSYTIAPAVAIASLLLSLPTAYAFGRMTFRGKAVAEMLTLIPLVMPGMLIGIFFSAMLINLNIDNAFISIVIGHTVLTLPYSIRIMSAGFKAVPLKRRTQSDPQTHTKRSTLKWINLCAFYRFFLLLVVLNGLICLP